MLCGGRAWVCINAQFSMVLVMCITRLVYSIMRLAFFVIEEGRGGWRRVRGRAQRGSAAAPAATPTYTIPSPISRPLRDPSEPPRSLRSPSPPFPSPETPASGVPAPCGVPEVELLQRRKGRDAGGEGGGGGVADPIAAARGAGGG